MARYRIACAVIAGFLATASFAAPAQNEVKDVTTEFLQAGASPVERLQVYELGGILIIRGRTPDRAVAEEAGRVARTLGYMRVANLVQVTAPADDSKIERQAERAISEARSLDGCSISVDATKGVLRLAGRVQHELQKDLAVQVVRNIAGVEKVESALQR